MGRRKAWDRQMKWIFSIAPEDLVAWIFRGEAEFVNLANTELDGDELFSDMLCFVKILGQVVLLHIEFQKRRDSNMAKRLWEYNVRATIKYKCPAWSCVIYLTKDSTVQAQFRQVLPNGRPIHWFDFDVIKMWETPTEDFLQMGLRGLLPLLPLTREGKRRGVIETAISLLMLPGGEPQGELLSLVYGFASLVLESKDQEWLDWRFAMLNDILRETPAFQKIAKEGLREGLEQGLQQGRIEGRVEGRVEGRIEGRIEGEKLGALKNLRQVAENLVATRFTNAVLTDLARNSLSTIEDIPMLQQLVVNLAIVQTPEEVRQLLTNS